MLPRRNKSLLIALFVFSLFLCAAMNAQAQVMRKKDAPIQSPPIPTVPLDHSVKDIGTTPPEGYEIRCRGGKNAFEFWYVNPNPRTAPSNVLSLHFSPSPRAAGADGSGLTPGTCSWIDRHLRDNEPRKIQYLIDVGEQAKHKDHLNQPNNYWSFFVVNTTLHYLEAKSHQRWDYQVKVETAPSKEVDIEAHEPPWVLKTKPNEDATEPAPTNVTVEIHFETLYAPDPIGRLRFDIKSKNEFTSKDQTEILDERYTGRKGVRATLNKWFTINDALPLLGIEVKAESSSRWVSSAAAEYDLTKFSGYNRTIPFTLGSPETDDQGRPVIPPFELKGRILITRPRPAAEPLETGPIEE